MVTRIRITKVTDADDIARQIEPHMRQLGQATGARMQRIVPKRTWALHDTIAETTERSRTKVTTTISFGGGDVNYGMAVEKGTSKMRAQPFARPALEQSRNADLNYSGKGIINKGEQRAAARQRRRDRAQDRATARRENAEES